MKYYHITLSKNISSIYIKGIKPGFCKGITTRAKTFKDKVFLTNNVNKIFSEQIGKYKEGEWSVIEIDINGLEIKPHEYHFSGTYTLSDFEFTTPFIPVKNIKING